MDHAVVAIDPETRAMSDDVDAPLRFAHPVRRLMAYLLDGIFLALLIFGAAVITTVVLGPTVRFQIEDGAQRLVVDAGRVFVNAIVGTLISALYFIGSWTRSGRTPGQAAFAIRVGRVEDGSPLAIRAAVVRWAALGSPIALVSPIAREAPGGGWWLTFLAGAWFIVLLVTTVVDDVNRGVHDRLAGSVVVRDARRFS